MDPEIIILISLLIVTAGYVLVFPKLKHSRFISYFIVPSLLLFIWVVLLLYQSFKIENVPSILTDEFPRSALSTTHSGELYQGQKFIGQFTASDNHLGIVGFRFWTFYRLNNDYLIFRLKETRDVNWYYVNSHKADQFQPNQYFTFGFPPITDSKGKTYVFEIESSQGRPGAAVGLSDLNPVFIAKYKYPSTQITASPASFLHFSIAKLINLFKKTEFTASSYIYILPFLLYLLSMSKRRFPSLLLLSLGFAADIFYVSKGDVPIAVLSLLFIFVYRNYIPSRRTVFWLGLIGLAASAVFYYFHLPLASQRAGAWSWLFLVLTVFLTPRLTQVSPNRLK